MKEPDVTPLTAVRALGMVWNHRDPEGRIAVERRIGDPEANGQPYKVTLIVEPCQ